MERNIDKEKSETAYITFSQKMIAWEKNHTDPTKIDKNTNEIMKVCAVKLPSKEYRSMQFNKDSTGIERNERLATINVVKSFIKDNRNKDGDLLNHYTYLDPNREYNINFKGKEIGQENGKKLFDKPEQIKLTGKELTKMFAESREYSLKFGKEKDIQKETEKVTVINKQEKETKIKKETKMKKETKTKKENRKI